MDEKIIPLKMEQLEHREMSLSEGYFINGKMEKFTKTLLFNERITIFLPESFVDMPEPMKTLKYPSVAHPQIVKTNLGGTVNFTFNLLEHAGETSGRETANLYRITLAKTNPSMNFSELDTRVTKNGIEINCFDFIAYGLDEQLYHKMMLTVIQGNLLHIGFNCLERDCYVWKEAVEEVFMSLEQQEK